MSARQYTITVKLKDGGSLKQIENLEKNGIGRRTSGSAAMTSGGGVGGILKKIESLNLGQLAVLGGIGVSLGVVANQMIKSSGILQGTFKLWETSISLLFRPIADFIGLIFRPVLLGLWSSFIIPFYKTVYPFFREWGSKIGDALANKLPGLITSIEPLMEKLPQFLEDIGKSLIDAIPSLLDSFPLFLKELPDLFAAFPLFVEKLPGLLESLPKFIEKIPNIIESIPDLLDSFPPILEKIPDLLASFPPTLESLLESLKTLTPAIVEPVKFLTDFWNHLVGIPPAIAKLFTDFGTNVWNHLIGIPPFIGGLFVSFGQNLFNGLLSVPNMIVDVFSGLASNLGSALANIPSLIRDAIMAMINSIGGRGNLPGTSLPPGSGTPVAPAIRRAQLRTQIAGIADTLD